MKHLERKTNRRFLAALITPLIAVALVFGTSLYFLPAAALGRSAAGGEMIQTDGEPANDGTPIEIVIDPTETPKPTPSIENTAETTATPESTVTPEPSFTPEATQTPLVKPVVEFSGTLNRASVSLKTETTWSEQAAYTLNIKRWNASDDSESSARYRTLLEKELTADQLQKSTIYELHYTVNGEEITPPSSSAAIELCDSAALDLLASDSVRMLYLVGNDSPDSMEIQTATAHVKDGVVSLLSNVCPSAIVLYGDALANGAETPAPEATDGTLEPSPTPTALPLYEYQNDGLYVSGSPAASDVLPEGAALTAERITSENNPERYAKYAEMLKQIYGTEQSIPFYAYDISFQVAGQEVEPAGDVVNVTIQDAAISESVEEPLVYHVVNEQSTDPALQEIPAEAAAVEGEDQIVFSADSFSVFIVLANGTKLTLADNSGLTYKIIATAADQFTNTSYYNSSRALGIAGNFHIVAFDTATLGAHTNGNVLANKVSANSNFGTNGLTDELSYIQNYVAVNGVSATSNTHVLVLGSANTITAMDNGNAFGINGTKLDRPKNLWQDQSTASLPFIDLVPVKASAKSRSASLKNNVDAYITPHLSTTGGSCTESYLTLNNVDKVGFYNITASALSGYTYFGVQGFQSGHSGTVIINVDCTGYSGALTLPECRMYYGTGGSATAVNFTEVTNFTNGRILWNLYNYTGNLTTRLLYASLLAPDASVTLGQNMNGTVIANNVTVSAESHRDDFLGGLSNGVTVTGTKVWSDYATGAPANTSVTFQLYRSTDGGTTRTAYGSPVTRNATTGWSYNWTELPTGSLYTIVETTVLKGSTDVTSSYAATYSTQTGVASGTITVSNRYLYNLPETGGAGVLAFYLSGGGLLLLATLLVLRKRRSTR